MKKKQQETTKKDYKLELPKFKREYNFTFDNLSVSAVRKKETINETPQRKIDEKRTDQVETLYEYIVDKSVNGIYKKESVRDISRNLAALGYKMGKTMVSGKFKEIVEKGWLTEVETNKQYNLTRAD